MIVALRNPCSPHRAALVDFVDRRELGWATAAALSHLDRCRTCEEELSGIALAIAALRRLRREIEAEEPAADAWVRLRNRIQRPIDPWPWRARLAGLLAGTFLVAVVVFPAGLGGPGRFAWVSQVRIQPVPAEELRAEQAYISAVRAFRPPSPAVVAPLGSIPRLYPDGVRPQKEVNQDKLEGRPPLAI